MPTGASPLNRQRLPGTALARPLSPVPVSRTATPAAPRTGVNPAVPPAPQLPGGVDESIAGQTGPTATPGMTPGTVPAVVPPPPTTPVPAATLTPRTQTATPTQGVPLPQVPPTVQPVQPPAGGGGLGPTLTPTDPENPLTTQTIGAGAGLNRFDLAKQQYDTFVASTDPSYQAALRGANRYAAAGGRLGLGTGGLRGDLGNLARGRDVAMRTERDRLFNDALLGSVDDARFATGLTERQQQFQSGEQQRLFENELRRLGFDEDLINSAFGRALGTFNAGNVGGTGSGTVLAGAGSAQSGADASTAALSELIRLLSQGRTSGTGG